MILRVRREILNLSTLIALGAGVIFFPVTARCDFEAVRYIFCLHSELAYRMRIPPVVAVEVPMEGVAKFLPEKLTPPKMRIRNARDTARAVLKPFGDWIGGKLRDPGNRVDFRAEFKELFHLGAKYNFVIAHNRMVIARTGSDFFADAFSKHMLLAVGFSDIRYAGEIWIDEEGWIHVSNFSGSYKPDASLLSAVASLIRENWDINEVVLQPYFGGAP